MFTLTAHITPFPNWKVEVKGSGFSASHLIYFLTLCVILKKRVFLYLPGTETLTLLQGASCEYFRRDDMCHPEAICFSSIQIPVSFSGNPPCESSKPAAGLRRGTCLMKSRWIGNWRQVVRFTEWCQLWSRHNRICNEVICNLIILRAAQVSFISKPWNEDSFTWHRRKGLWELLQGCCRDRWTQPSKSGGEETQSGKTRTCRLEC